MLVNLIVLLAIVAVLVFVPPTHASPTAFIVDSTLDEPAAVAGVCVSTPSGKCTLRAAIQAANFVPGADTIILSAGTYTLTIPGANEDNAATGDLDITDALTITGAGSNVTVIDGNQLDRVFHVLTTTVVIQGVTIRDGQVSSTDRGGAIYNTAGGAVSLVDVLVGSNTGGFGGGIFNAGILTITNGSILLNATNGVTTTGGGIYSAGSGRLAVSNTTFMSNTSYNGAGIYDLGALSAANSRFEGNRVTNAGGAILLNGNAIIAGSTFKGNLAYAGGGVYINHAGALAVTNSLFSGNVVSDSGGGIFDFTINQLTISGVTFTNNVALGTFCGSGGGLANNPGSFAVIDASSFMANTADCGGGGIRNSGTMTITNTIFAGNTTTNTNSSRGGGILNMNSGTLTILKSAFTKNSAYIDGGGILNVGSLTITNSTFSSNVSEGIHQYLGARVNIVNSTFVSNTSTFGGGNIGDDGGSVTLKNTIVAFGIPGNCSRNFISQGHNLEYGNTCGLTASGDITNTDPLIGPMLNNGGATPTHALLAGSPAIDAGDDVGCPATDQRGIARPQGPHCDIGAYEVAGNSLYLPLILR